MSEGEKMSLAGHLGELRKRLIVSLVALAACAVAAYAFSDAIIAFLLGPFLALKGSGASALYATTIFEGFMVQIRVALAAGLVLSSPVHVANVLGFVLPALKPKEKRVLWAALGAGLCLVGGGFVFSYYSLIPAMFGFLSGAGFLPPGVGMLLGYEENLFYVIQFLFACVLAFQLPVVLEILLALRAVTRRALLRAGRWVVLGIVVVAAVITPSPDFVTQLALALPLIGLYYLAILVAKLLGIGKERCSA